MSRTPACLAALLLTGCVRAPGGPTAVFDPDGDGFYSTPWPADARLNEAGNPDWSSFPNPTQLELLDAFLAVGDRTPGFGHNAPIYFRVDDQLDPALLPTAQQSLDPRSPLQLVDVDPRSPTWGQRVPLRWEQWDAQGTYIEPGLVAVSPLPGFPLRPRTTYALVVTTAIASPSTDFEAAWESGSWAETLRPLRDSLPILGLDRADVALATTFTTGDPLATMEVMARFLDERVSPPTFRRELEFRYDLGTYDVYRTDYTTPVFMQGERPYDQSGGDFGFREDGMPQVVEWDDMRMSVVLPQDRGPAPETGWPVMVYLHGTGGNYRTYCNSDRDLEVAQWLAPLGVVGLGIDLPLHGPRGNDDTIIDLHSFNVLQPDSALHIHRQAAIDLLYLLDGLTEGQVVLETPEGEPVPLYPDRIVVMGHSQGALTTSIALPWAGEAIDGAVLSGGGGLLAITAVERDADFDFPALITGLLGFADDEPLSEMHPVLGLVQSLVEPTDPINYARYWYAEDGGYTNSEPTPVLHLSGIRDDATPYRTAEALAAAAGMPFAGERFAKAEGLLLAGLDSQSFPVSDNLTDWNGQPITAGLSQWADGTHFVVFEEPDARDLVRNFVYGTLQGDGPVIDEGPPPLEEDEAP
jgi:hypothetical protein